MNKSDAKKLVQILKDINHLFVWHGRKTCDSRKPLCNQCTIREYCKYYQNT